MMSIFQNIYGKKEKLYHMILYLFMKQVVLHLLDIYKLLPGSETEDGYKIDVLEVIPQDDDNGDRIVVNFVTTISEQLETTGQIELVYNRFVQYLGEITGISNVQEANRNYTEVYAHI